MPSPPLHCQHCARTYTPDDAFRAAALSCAACGGPLGERQPDGSVPERKDPFRGRRIAGAVLRKRLTVLPTRSIYAARHEKLRRDVRVEVLASDFAEANMDYVRRLFAGAARTQDLHSLRVTTVIDLGRLPDCCYVITESADGDLAGLLDRKVRLPARRALRIAEEVLQGLQAIEEAGSAHGNVTPDGILIGQDGAARLSHLGTALRPEDLRRLTVTPRGMLAGPALYIAPEREADNEPDIASDLHSLGCTLYHMLAGRPPVVGLSADDIRQKRAAGLVPGLQVECPGLPQPASDFVARLMAQRPEDRPASAAEALSELRALAAEGAATPARRKLFDATWTGAWTVVAVLLVIAMVAPFVIMARMHRAQVAQEQAAAVHDPGAVAVVVRPLDPRTPDALGDEDALAVRALLAYRISFYPGMSALPDAVEGTPVELHRKLGVEQTLTAGHAAGLARRNWTLAFTALQPKPWVQGADAAVEQNATYLASLDAAARDLMRVAAAHLGLQVPNPAEDAVVKASAQEWAEVGRALQAEAAGRWDEAAQHAQAAGPAFAALADYYSAVRSVGRDRPFPPAWSSPAGSDALGAGRHRRDPAHDCRRQRGRGNGAIRRLPGEAPALRARLLPARPLSPEGGRPARRSRPIPPPRRRVGPSLQSRRRRARRGWRGAEPVPVRGCGRDARTQPARGRRYVAPPSRRLSGGVPPPDP